ncbi:hypothetical protein ACSBR1_015726 [Camellia fascicularis]
MMSICLTLDKITAIVLSWMIFLLKLDAQSTPNENVLYDHEDKKMPHIMFFAAENIPPLQELTYHYNYSVDEIRDSNDNIKKKNCYCGSEECTGRTY